MGQFSLIIASILVATGCSTLASKERLEHQNQLLILEIKNHEHTQEMLKSEIENMKLLLNQNEQKLTELSQSSEDKSHALEDLKKNLSLENQKRTELEKSCQTLVEQIKSGLTSGRLQNKTYRLQFLQSLDQWQTHLGEPDHAKTSH